MSRVVALIDGEHYAPVVRSALEGLASEHEVLAAVFAGGTEKLGEGRSEDIGVPVVRADTVDEALLQAIGSWRPDAVIDLSDEPVVTSADRFRLAGLALRAGVSYSGADFAFTPALLGEATVTPALAITGTGKRVGKTAVSAHAARTLTVDGTRVAVVAMGRGGPEEPELIRGDEIVLTTADLLAFARAGAHAASDCYEDAVMSRVATVGCRRCGGGMAGATFFSNVVEGARLADALGKDLLLFEGSGAALPPVPCDAELLVVGASQGPEYVTRYFGPVRLARADAVVITGAEEPLARRDATAALVEAVRSCRPGVPICLVTMRPRPIEPVAGARVFYATTAPPALLPVLVAHLESVHGCRVVGASSNLSDRAGLRRDLQDAGAPFDLLLTELKAAAVDLVAAEGERLGAPTVFADNVPQDVGGAPIEDTIRTVARLAAERGVERGHDGC
jgi:cyclic 2,3-diphosphoglycerate synthetase